MEGENKEGKEAKPHDPRDNRVRSNPSKPVKWLRNEIIALILRFCVVFFFRFFPFCCERFCEACQKWEDKTQFHSSKSICEKGYRRHKSIKTLPKEKTINGVTSPLFPKPEHASKQTPLSLEARGSVVGFDLAGFTSRKIAHTIPCSKATVFNLRKKYQATNSVLNREKSGRKPILGDEEKTVICARTALDPGHSDPRQLVNELNIESSPRTVRRFLNSEGLTSHIQQSSHEFSERERNLRLSFAHGYLDWEETEWDLVVPCDETKFSTNDNTQRHVQCGPGEQYLAKNRKRKELHPSNLNGWGCFSSAGVGTLYLYPQTLDAQYYESILDCCLPESVEKFFQISQMPRQWYLLQDNVSLHFSPNVKHWYHNHGVINITFPPWSPDLNPIENLFHDVKQRMSQFHAVTDEELSDAAIRAWEETDPQYCRNLMHGMPKRLQKVIENDGFLIKH
jgi:transposase